MFFKEPLLNGTREHIHIRSHLYTEVLASSSQTKLTLRDLNFHSVRGPMSPTLAKKKKKKRKKERKGNRKKNR